jgi:hypothetical protein
LIHLEQLHRKHIPYREPNEGHRCVASQVQSHTHSGDGLALAEGIDYGHEGTYALELDASGQKPNSHTQANEQELRVPYFPPSLY